MDPKKTESSNSKIKDNQSQASSTSTAIEEQTPSVKNTETNAKFEEILHKIEEEIEVPPEPKRPAFRHLAHILSTKLKKVAENFSLKESKTTIHSVDEKHEHHENRFKSLISSVRKSIGVVELIRELRAKEAQYVHQVEEYLAEKPPNVTYTEDHPYVALRKRIEAMSRTGKEEYRVKYEPLSNKPKFLDSKIPIYCTNYDNERKKQARRRQFMFGLGSQDRFDADILDAYFYNPNEKPDPMHWNSKEESDIAFLALVFSVSNLFRFPHACYVNGGIIFFLVYCLLIVTLIRPLVFFEMLIGQFSWKGEWGFGKLHRYAKGFPHALTFVNLTFVTLNNAILGYAGLYAVGAIYSGPGECNPEWTDDPNSCIPYNKLANEKERLVEKSVWIRDHIHDPNVGFQNATLFLSTEIFFRYYVLNWKGKMSRELYHWKFVAAFMVILVVVIPASVQSQLVSTISRLWIYFACILPIFLSVILFHQYAFRDGYNTPRYFSIANWDRLGTLTLWRDAFEMAFTTVGVGYGLFIRVATRNDFRFNKINHSSWIISIFVMIFTLLCSMVVYTELAILGLIAEAKEFTQIFAEGFGVSFVCLSGAILKIMPTWAFSISFFGMNMFNIWPQIVVTQMSTEYISGLLPFKNKSACKAIGLGLTISFEIMLISIYAAHQEYAKSDSFDLYGGSGAACMMLLVEIGIAFVLWGFREFMTDIELMLDQQLSFIYQIQMKYYITPALLSALFMIAVSWLSAPPSLDLTRSIGAQTYYFAILLNTTPMVIMAAFAFQVFWNRNKVAPEVEDTKFIERARGLDLYWRNKSRYMIRRGAVATTRKGNLITTSRASLWTNYALKVDLLAAKEVYYVHADLKRSLRELLAKTKSKAKWKELVNKIVLKGKIKSLSQLTRIIMRKREAKRLSKEVTFLRNIIHQCSVCDLATTSAKKLEGKVFDEQESILIDHLLKNTDIDSSDDSICSMNINCDGDGPQQISKILDLQYDSSSDSLSSGDSRPVLRKILGKLSQTPEEIKLDLVVRIKKALDLSCETEMTALRNMRTRRFYNETNAPWWSMVNPPPEERFITIKVTKRDNPEGIILNIRIIILRDSNHFVLQRLPVPRPLIVHATNERLETLPGSDTNHKVSSLVIGSLKETLWRANLNTLGPENRTPLLDNLDMDIYRFIDPIRSCVVILESNQEVYRLKNKWRWLQQPTRRQRRLEDIPLKHYMPFEIEEVTFAGMTQRQKDNEEIDKMLAEPTDIVYHRPSNDIWSPEPTSPPPSRYTSSSSSNEPVFIPSHEFDTRPEISVNKLVGHGNHVKLVDEAVMRQKRNEFRKQLRGYESSTTQNSLYDIEVKHLTNYDWKKNKSSEAKPIIVLHKNPEGLKSGLSVKYLNLQPPTDDMDDMEEDVEIPEPEVSATVNDFGSTRSIWSEAELRNQPGRRAYSVNTVPSSTRSVKDFSNLQNNYADLAYYTDGKTLIIEPKDSVDDIIMASSEDSIASAIPSKRTTKTGLTRTEAKITFGDPKEFM